MLPPPPLLPLIPLTLIENLVFNEKSIKLDGYRFRNCAFVNCTLEVRRGNFRLEECFFQGNWWCSFDGDAQRIAKLFTILDSATIVPGLKAVLHENGGVSIT